MKILPNKINKFFDSILSELSVPKKDRNLLVKSLLESSIKILFIFNSQTSLTLNPHP